MCVSLASKRAPSQRARARDMLKSGYIPRSTRLTILDTVLKSRNNTMQQYDFIVLSKYARTYSCSRIVLANLLTRCCARLPLLLCVVETGTCGANVCARADTQRRAWYIGVGIPTTGARVQAY
jgi:hypothetical protein